jgi:hypothetical protein
MKELLKLLIEETEAEERSYWYTHGYEAEQSALRALAAVLQNVQYRLDNDGV